MTEDRRTAKEEGRKTYSGNDCTQFHGGERYVSNNNCVQCQKLNNKRYREDNPEYQSNWWKRNPEAVQEKRVKSAEWKRNNSARTKELKKNWDQQNEEYRREYRKQQYATNAEKYREYAAKYFKTEKGKISKSASEAKRRARMGSFELTREEDAQVKHIYEQCYHISALFDEKFNVDHFYPLNGKTVCGLHVPWNLRIMRASDNVSKSNSTPTEEYDGFRF